MPLVSAQEWDSFLQAFPGAHLLQSAAWGELKAAFGWEVKRVVLDHAGAQVLFRRLPLGFCLAYIPRGPVGEVTDRLWAEIDTLCRKERAVFLKVELDAWEGDSGSSIPDGFLPAIHTIQPRRTLVIDLCETPEKILGQMKQKTRYNIRLAEKKGVDVRMSDQVEDFFRLMVSTGARDSFGVHSLAYYRRAFDLFSPNGEAALLMAEYEGEPLAGLMAFRRGSRAWYFYGASSDSHRNLMAPYLLQWQAMLWAKNHRVEEYDLWGVPDEDEETLEAGFTNRQDGLWGVYRFKRGFGGILRRSAGAWDRVYNPLLYNFYRLWMKRESG